jgi:hypothetical protein
LADAYLPLCAPVLAAYNGRDISPAWPKSTEIQPPPNGMRVTHASTLLQPL